MDAERATFRSMNKLLTVLLLAVLLIFAVSLTLGAEGRDLLLEEGGILEMLSAVGYGVCALLILLWGKGAYLRRYHYFFMLVVLFGLRELDFDKRFTTMGMFKSKFYLSDEVSGVEKIIGLMVIGLLLYIVFSIIRHHAKDLLSKVKAASPVHVGAFAVLVLLVLSKTLDGFARKMSSLNVMISEQASMHTSAMEEILECAIPVILIFTFYAYFFGDKVHQAEAGR